MPTSSRCPSCISLQFDRYSRSVMAVPSPALRRGIGALCVLLCSAVPARAERQKFLTFSGADGLSQGEVTALVQDEAGFLWVGTKAGLNRFDGQRFRVFREGEGDIRALALAPDGGIYIGTGSGLELLQDGKIVSFGSQRGLPQAEVVGLATDDKGSLWTAGPLGLYRYRGTRFERMPQFGKSVQAILRCRNGDLWVATAQNMFRWSKGQLQVVTGLHGQPSMTTVSALTEGAGGRIYAGHRGGVAVIEGVQVVEHIETFAEDEPLMMSLHVDAQGYLWWGDSAGLVRWDGHELRRFGGQDKLSVTSVHAIIEDRDGNFWLGGDGGLARFAGRAFTTYDESDGLPAASTRAILRTRDHKLWVGTKLGLARKDGKTFTAFGLKDGLPGRFVTSLLEDDEGRLWVGTHRGLAVQSGPGTWSPRPFGLAQKSITSLARDSLGRIWVAQAETGVFKIENGKAQAVELPGRTFKHPRLTVDARDHIWVSSDQGLTRLGSGAPKHYGIQEGLAHRSPCLIVAGPEDTIWFAYHSPQGFSRIDRHGAVTTWTRDDGLTDDAVYSLGFDPDDNLWVGSARGVDRFDRESTFDNFSLAEGYASTESNSGGFYVDGPQIWFGTGGGLSKYVPEQQRTRSRPVRLSNISIQLSSAVVEGAQPTIPHDQHDLDVHFDIIDFRPSKPSVLRARLRGYSDEWQQLMQPTWMVPDLPPGTYRLELEAIRGDSTFSEGRSFIIDEPPWASWWALAAGGLGLLLCIVWVSRLRVHSRIAVLEAETDELIETQEEKLRRSNAELRAANATKSQFVANVSHEIRTPLNGIIGMSELALLEDCPPHLEVYLKTIHSSGAALLTLVNDILDISRIESGRLSLELRPTSIRRLLEDVRSNHAAAASAKGLRLAVSVGADVHDQCLADSGRIRQILVNLVGNAVKFTSTGFVSVSVSTQESGARSSEAQALVISVEDSGLGISEGKLDLVFDKFTQADGSTTREFGGSGLGLTICRQLAELMGGSIRVHSELSKGSTFVLEIPLQRDLRQVTSSPSELPRPVSGARPMLRVLVAEDNVVNQKVICKMLERLGHSSHVVVDGRAAVEAFHARPFDLILMDLQMPELDGRSATQLIRAQEAQGHRVPIIALTAHAMTGDREKSMAAGMDDYLTKPLTVEALEVALAGLRPRPTR